VVINWLLLDHSESVLVQKVSSRHPFVLLIVVVERVHGLLVLPVHPAFFTVKKTQQNKIASSQQLLLVFEVNSQNMFF